MQCCLINERGFICVWGIWILFQICAKLDQLRNLILMQHSTLHHKDLSYNKNFIGSLFLGSLQTKLYPEDKLDWT